MTEPVERSDAGRVLAEAVRRSGEALGLPEAEVAELLGVEDPSIPGEIHPDSGTGRAAILLTRLFTNLDAMVNGDPDSMRGWLRADHTLLGRPPIEELRRAGGLVRVVDLLDGYRARR